MKERRSVDLPTKKYITSIIGKRRYFLDKKILERLLEILLK